MASEDEGYFYVFLFMVIIWLVISAGIYFSQKPKYNEFESMAIAFGGLFGTIVFGGLSMAGIQ